MAPMALFDDDLDFSNPAAASAYPTPAAEVSAAPPATILVVGNQAAAANGSYQALVQELSLKGSVEMQMVDRIVEQATTLTAGQYQQIAVILPSGLITATLVSLLEAALVAGGSLEVRGEAAASDEVVGELRLVGLAAVLHEGGALVATKAKVTSVPLSFKKRPASSIDTTSAPASSSVALPLRTSRAAKASLWAFTTNNPATIDESTLLTDEDLARPTLVKREDCDVKRTRKACKNCSCGLKELLLEEQDDLVQAGFAEPVATVAPKKKGVKKMSASVTSSCGNCYLGDAFRCGSCPYLGMPAFEPGAKVTMSGFDDALAL